MSAISTRVFAIQTFGMAGIAMQLDHLFAGHAACLMQGINILGDDMADLAARHQPGHDPVAVIGLDSFPGLLHLKPSLPRNAPGLRISDIILKAIGSIFVQTPPGERKSGMPDSVEIPAPVKTTARREDRISCASSSAPFTAWVWAA